MTSYDNIYEFAVDNHYLISTTDAGELGIPAIEFPSETAERANGLISTICSASDGRTR